MAVDLTTLDANVARAVNDLVPDMHNVYEETQEAVFAAMVKLTDIYVSLTSNEDNRLTNIVCALEAVAENIAEVYAEMAVRPLHSEPIELVTPT